MLNQDIEDLPQLAQVGFLAEDVQEAGEVPQVGDMGGGGDAEQAVDGGVAVQFGQTGLDGEMPQGDGENDDAPEVFDGKIVAAATAGLVESGEQWLVGQDLEELTEGSEVGMIFELGPGE